jgi:hypothetical protein
LEEFWKIPLEPYTRILPTRGGHTLSKIIAVRKYWVDIDLVSQPDYKKVEQKRKKEREIASRPGLWLGPRTCDGQA